MKQVWLNNECKMVQVLLPTIDFFTEKIVNDEHFVYVKVNHGWWESILRENMNPNVNAFKHRKRREGWYNNVKPHIYKKQYDKWVKILREYDKQPENLYVGVSHTNGLFDVIKNVNYSKKVLSIIKEWNPNRMYYHGGLFRQYVILNEIQELIDAINNSETRVHYVGPDYTDMYCSLFRNFNHIKVDYKSGANDINKILNKIVKNKDDKNIILASFGDSESLLIDTCFKEKISMIGVGRALDYLFKDKIETTQQWFNTDYKILKKNATQWRKSL